MSQDLSRQAGQMVDLIKAIIQDERAKSDQIMTGTIFDRNEEDDTYSIYVDTDTADGKLTLMTNIPNESKHVYSRGDHVYVMKVRGQIAQAFIIGSIGSKGTSVNAQVDALSSDLQALTGMVRSLGIPNNRFSIKAEPLDIYDRLGFVVTWNGPVLPEAIQLRFTLGSDKKFATFVKAFDVNRGVTYTYDANATPPSDEYSLRRMTMRECHLDPAIPYQTVIFWPAIPVTYSESADYAESVLVLGGLSIMNAGLKIDI